jgi:branched-chain amino acid transport system ATP-binding protein
MKEISLELKKVTINYDAVIAVKSLSLHLNCGETISLLGGNGAGKSTILGAISGIKEITSGEIWFEGKRIDGAASQDIVKMGIVQVPEGRRLFKNMTVLENLLTGAYLCKGQQEIDGTLKRVYDHFPILGQRNKQYAGSLSGGEQQMLAIARGLMAMPRLLLLDEPSMGLAPVMVGEIGKIINEIGESGISILLVEQNARLAFKLSKRGYVLETGRLVLDGETERLEMNDMVRRAYLGG